MTKKDAYQLGRDEAEEINCCGDFEAGELSSADRFLAAFWEIAENRKQYSDSCTYDFRREAEWEGYEDGLSDGANRAVKARKLS
jgi:hypothetical protein